MSWGDLFCCFLLGPSLGTEYPLVLNQCQGSHVSTPLWATVASHRNHGILCLPPGYQSASLLIYPTPTVQFKPISHCLRLYIEVRDWSEQKWGSKMRSCTISPLPMSNLSYCCVPLWGSKIHIKNMWKKKMLNYLHIPYASRKWTCRRYLYVIFDSQP